MRIGKASICLFGAMLMIAGCQDEQKKTVLQENPPPKPPNCPELPERRNVTLADGSVADVRILQFADVKLYIPRKWVESEFVQNDVNSSNFGKFTPDMNDIECNGVVHRLNLDQEAPLKTLWLSGRQRPINILPESAVSMLHFTVDVENPGERLRAVYRGLHHLPSFFPIRGLVVYADLVNSQPISTIKSQSILDFTRWLATPPATRDNNQTFNLKVYGQ